MTTEVQKLQQYLDERGMRLGGMTLGDNPGTPDDVAKAIRESLEAIERGECEELVIGDSVR